MSEFLLSKKTTETGASCISGLSYVQRKSLNATKNHCTIVILQIQHLFKTDKKNRLLEHLTFNPTVVYMTIDVSTSRG